MTIEELTNKVVKKSIRSAACIDDEYIGPYEVMKPGLIQDKPAELYMSFRKEANCDLDIYHYESFEKWIDDKEYVLNSKDLLILDWEIDKELPIKYRNTIKILEEALINPFIQYIIIHTHANDIEVIYKTILYNFLFSKASYNSDTYTLPLDTLIGYIREKIEEDAVSGVFDEDDFDVKADDFRKNIPSLINGFTLNIKVRGDIKKSFYEYIDGKFDINKSERLLKKLAEYLEIKIDIFFILLDMVDYFKEDKLLLDTKRLYTVKEIEDVECPTLFLNNTFITVFAKENAAESTLPKVAVKDVFSAFSACITNLPNNSLSSIISLEIKDLYRQTLAAFGKGLAGIDERALVYHLSSYETIEERYEYLLQIWNNQISILTINNSDTIYLPEMAHFDIHKDVNPNDIEKELIDLVSSIMISPHFSISENRDINLGDIFKTDQPLNVYKRDDDDDPAHYEYLLCISPICDCAHPEIKISNNYSFLYGKLTKPSVALKNAETDYCTFLPDKVIKWSYNPFTIYIDNRKLISTGRNYIRFNDRSLKIHYIATMKEMFVQRISNYAFSNNMRIGLDLPHLRKKPEK
jgi:hypothetical protein